MSNEQSKKRIAHVLAWEASNLSQKAYCQRESLSYNSFVYWRCQLKTSMQKPSFIEVKTPAPLVATNNALVLQISLLNGTRIGISAQASMALITQVLAVVGGTV